MKYQRKNYIPCLRTHTMTTPYMGIGYIIVRYKQTSTNSYEFVTIKSIKICRFITFRVGYLEFVVITRLERESLHVQPSFG